MSAGRVRRAGLCTAAALCAAALAACRPLPPPAPPAAAIAAAPARTVADDFLLTFWCGPPLDQFSDARAREIAAAGFNVIGATCQGPFNPELNRRALDRAARHGLRIILKDHRLVADYPLAPGWQEAVSQAVAEYRGHPGLAGFLLVDEPVPDQFDDVAALARRIQREDPNALAYVNLLPDYVFEDELGGDAYREYLEDFVLRAQPRLLSYDHYPFLAAEEDRPSFFANLSTVRAVALEYQVPFMLIVLAMPHGPYRDPSEAELAWQALHGLAFGARGISYFAYWTPVGVPDAAGMRFRRGLIEGGAPTRHYHEAARLNRQLRALARELEGFRSVAVHDSGGRFGAALPPGPLRALEGDALSAGVFAGADGAAAVLLVNQSYRHAARARLLLAPSARAPRTFDPGAARWSETAPEISLAPAAALLLRWEGGGGEAARGPDKHQRP